MYNENMKKRIFLAIDISDKLKKEILKFRQKFNDLPVRWVAKENLHLTLIPPLELNDKGIVEMIEKLQALKGKVGRIEINFNRISLGPNLRRPRLIWVGGKPNQKLIKLKNTITQILGLRRENRSFLPHLTLARFRPRDFYNFPQIRLKEKINWQEDAASFSIIQSECLEKGAIYTKMGEIEL